MTPAEFSNALDDFNDTHFTPMKRTCEMLRLVAKIVHNSTPGREKSDMIKDPKRIIRFGWETPKLQTVEEMKSFLMGLGHMDGVEVKQDGEKVDVIETSQEMKRTK